MKGAQSLRPVTGDVETGYRFHHSDANGFPRLLPPARKIGLGRRALSGIMPSDKGREQGCARFESSLERDFFVLLEFNIDVVKWEAQPFKIQLPSPAGTYTPDVMVTFVDKSRDISRTHRVLYEVKYREELKRDWLRLRDRYRAAWRFARSNGSRFKLITEREIRTELLWNAKFLLPYGHDEVYDDDSMRLLGQLRKLGVSTPRLLIESCTTDRMTGAKLLSVLWHLVANRRVGADLTRKLTMTSEIWVDE